MPQKCHLTVLSNRVHIKNVFAAARDSLKKLDRTLYHYASADHPMRKSSAELRRSFAALDKQLACKLKSGAARI